MYRTLSFDGSITVYNLALLAGVIFGWIAYVLEEDDIFSGKGASRRLSAFFAASAGYFIIVACCMQGSVYFHFLFDNIAENTARRMTFWNKVFANPLEGSRVLYGVFFMYPVGILLASLPKFPHRFWSLLDRKAFIAFIVVGFARIGCFFNGCCYGVRSEALGVCFPPDSVAAWEHMSRGYTSGGFMPPPSLPVIPTQAVSALFLFILAGFAFRATQQKKQHVFINYVFYYSIFRFLIEFLRDDLERAHYWIFSASQWIALFIFAMYGAWKLIQRQSLMK